MGPKRPKPLDLSSQSVPPAQPDPKTDAIDAPEDLDFEPREFRLAAQRGLLTAADDRLPAALMAPDLPALGAEERVGRVRAPKAWPFYLSAGVVSVLWALAPVMFAWGYRREIVPFASEPFALVILALLALGPVALVWLAAYVAHQGAKLASETRRAQALADTLLQPAALAARGAGTAVETVRREIEHATAAAGQARDELSALRDVLAVESRGLVEAAQASHRATQALTQSLGGEREKISLLVNDLDAQATGVTDAIARHARMVAEASDLAETQIREAEAALAARAADLAAAAGEASDTARIAGEDLGRQVIRLETAGQNVGDQVRSIEESLSVQRSALVNVVQDLRADNDAFAVRAESQRAQFVEIVAAARAGVGDIGESAERGAQALRDLITEAASQLREMTSLAGQQQAELNETVGRQRAAFDEAAGYEREQLSEAAARSLGAMAQIAAAERNALQTQTRETLGALESQAHETLGAIEGRSQETLNALEKRTYETLGALESKTRETASGLDAQARAAVQTLSDAAERARQAAETHAQVVRDKIDQLGEAAFGVGQRADAVFDTRLAEAKGLVEQSARMVEEAGARSVAQLASGVATARETLTELEQLLSDIDSRIAQLPADAENGAEQVRVSLARGMEALIASAHKAAEETQSIDAAFQDRVRRNYDMLSQAVRLMGVVAGAASTAPPPLEPPPPLPPPPPMPPPAPQLNLPPRPVIPEPDEPLFADEVGLRPRLKLTPTASDEEFKTVFEAAGGREAATESRQRRLDLEGTALLDGRGAAQRRLPGQRAARRDRIHGRGHQRPPAAVADRRGGGPRQQRGDRGRPGARAWRGPRGDPAAGAADDLRPPHARPGRALRAPLPGASRRGRGQGRGPRRHRRPAEHRPGPGLSAVRRRVG